MKDDFKFGWHASWIVPVLLIATAYDAIADRIEERAHNRKINKILKNNPDIKELSDLSGIK